MTRFLIAAALLVWTFTPATAEPYKEDYDVRTFTCPIGGKKFKQDVGYSSFPLITLTDGSWLGDAQIGVQIPICPDNGLVLIPDLAKSEADEGDKILYADYTRDERTKLPSLIADPAYGALKSDGPYAQAYWLATKLGRPVADRYFMLQRSTWATVDPVLRRKRVSMLVSDTPALIDALPKEDMRTFLYRYYLVNALREMGQFAEATTALDGLERDVATIQSIPEEERGVPDADSMRIAIAEKDEGRHPAALLNRRIVSDVCNDSSPFLYGPTHPSTKIACKNREDREKREAERWESNQ